MNKPDTYEYAKDINSDLKHFEKLIYSWTYRTARMVCPNYSPERNTQLSFGPMGLTIEDIKQEMTIVVWLMFNKFNEIKKRNEFELVSNAYYVGMLDTALRDKSSSLYRQSSRIKRGKNFRQVNEAQTDNIFYGTNLDWNA